MEIEKIKAEILNIYSRWKNTSDGMAGDKDAELEESFVRDLIIIYCESKGYEVDLVSYREQIEKKLDYTN